MKFQYFIVLIAAFLGCNLAHADSRQDRIPEETMCYPHEEIYFSCAVGSKIVSVCASGNISPKNGYVKYRFGRPDKPELEYPTESVPPKDQFSISDFSGGSVNSIHLKFRSGGYIYVVYESATSGVYVIKNGKTVVNLLCDRGHYRQISPRAMRGIKTVEPDDNDD
jgi:hypothetical protein